ncbi:MAG: NAD(P)-dependent oxidoreductase [Alphaproteobacteria bacterium]|nr:NAD(P)-dependent oxidoreductase [Alphaproteobacteria bacterium]
MRVLVTGAGGFVGRVVARRLADQGHRVLALYRKTPPRDVGGADLLQADLPALAALPPLDARAHCAAEVPAFCPDPDRLYRGNVEGTRAVLDAAHAAGARRIVYLSSMSIYGTIADPVVTEATPSTDPDIYGRSKLEGEKLLAALSARDGAVAALAIRLPGVVGAGGRNNFLSNALARVLAGAAVAGNHADRPFNNVVHVEDLAGFVAQFLADPRAGYHVANIAARAAMPIRAVVALLYAGAGKPDTSSWSAAGKQPFTIALDRLMALGYRPATVRDSVERFVRDEMAARR